MLKRIIIVSLCVFAMFSNAYAQRRFSVSIGAGIPLPSGKFNDNNAQAKQIGTETFAKYNHGAEALTSYGAKLLYKFGDYEPFLHFYRNNFDMTEQFLYSIERTTSEEDANKIKRGKHHINVGEIGVRRYLNIFHEVFFAEGGLGYYHRKSTIDRTKTSTPPKKDDVLYWDTLGEKENKIGFSLGFGYRAYFSYNSKFDFCLSLNRTFSKPIQFWRFNVMYTNYLF